MLSGDLSSCQPGLRFHCTATNASQNKLVKVRMILIAARAFKHLIDFFKVFQKQETPAITLMHLYGEQV